MNIVQIDWRNSELLDLLRDDDVYFIRINVRNDKNSTNKVPHPYGLSFNRLNTAKFKELLPLLDSGEAAIVRVTKEG